MKYLLAGVIGLFALASVDAARAADMPIKAAPPAPAYSWTGFYIGVNGGYAWSDPAVTFAGNDITTQTFTCGGGFGSTCAPPASFNINGGLGGLQAGYNWQFNRNWLVGAEIDFDWSGLKGSGSTPNFPFGGAASNFQASQTINDFGTVRARFGYLAIDAVLLYGTGGFAYAHVYENAALNSTNTGGGVGGGPGFSCFTFGNNCFIGGSSRVAFGWTIGAGFEYSFWNNFSFKTEYAFVSLGSGDRFNVVNITPAAGVGIASFSANYSRLDFSIVCVGLNYKFQ
jgi:outer membrane immunogenic protein